MAGGRWLQSMMLAVYLFAPAGTYAQDAGEQTTGRTHCEKVAEYARTVMRARQQGVRMVDAMPSETVDKNTKTAMEAIVMAAYEQPRFASAEYQQKAVTDFENAIFLACLKEQR